MHPFRYWFKRNVSLIIFMGLNWIFGVLLFHEYLLPLVYVFAITTALQVRIHVIIKKSYFSLIHLHRVFGFLLSLWYSHDRYGSIYK